MNKIIISLTSYPDRISIVDQVILSLLKQTEQADEIILWLSTLEFPNKHEDLPDRLNDLVGKNNFRIEWVNENIKSHKKYFYVLKNSEDIVITVDDDMIYSEQMVSVLMESYRKHPHAVSARNVHIITKKDKKIAPYLSWYNGVKEYTGLERKDLCAIGVNGVLYPPRCGSPHWFNLSAMRKYAEDQDDLWLKFCEIIDGIPVVFTGMGEEDRVIEGAPGEPLHLKNAYGGANDECVEKLSGLVKKKHEPIYRHWFDNLMATEEFWSARREIYGSQLNDIMASRAGRPVYICGAGKYAHVLYDFIVSCKLEKDVTAFLVTENGTNKYQDKTALRKIGDLGEKEAFIALCGVSERYLEEMKQALAVCKAHEWVEMDLTGIEMLLQWEGRAIYSVLKRDPNMQAVYGEEKRDIL